MWESFGKILTSSNLWEITISICGLILLFAHLSKRGLISYKGHGLNIGEDENERRIINLQLDYVESELDYYFSELISENSVNPNLKFNETQHQLCKELIYDVLIKAIALNHITTDEFYVKGKHIKIKSELAKRNLSNQFTENQFKKGCYEEIQKIIENLVCIRKYYSTHK